MGISPRLATAQAVRGGQSAGGEPLGRVHTQNLLQLHDRAAGPQLVVHRVAVGVVLAMLVVILALVNGRGIARKSLGERGHSCWLWCVCVRM